MIYLKRLGLVLLSLLVILIGTVFTLLLIVTLPVWGVWYFIFTGNDPLKEDITDFIWDYVSIIIEWYLTKTGLE